MNSEHYFDWAATAPCDAEILRESLETAIQYDGNPSSVHKTGKEARKMSLRTHFFYPSAPTDQMQGTVCIQTIIL